MRNESLSLLCLEFWLILRHHLKNSPYDVDQSSTHCSSVVVVYSRNNSWAPKMWFCFICILLTQKCFSHNIVCIVHNDLLWDLGSCWSWAERLKKGTCSSVMSNRGMWIVCFLLSCCLTWNDVTTSRHTYTDTNKPYVTREATCGVLVVSSFKCTMQLCFEVYLMRARIIFRDLLPFMWQPCKITSEKSEKKNSWVKQHDLTNRGTKQNGV